MSQDIIGFLNKILFPYIRIADLFEVGFGHGIVHGSIQPVIQMVHFNGQFLRTDCLFQFPAVTNEEI